MTERRTHVCLSLVLLTNTLTAAGQTNTVVRHNVGREATQSFTFGYLPAPSSDDLATDATFAIVSGERDPNGAQLEQLHDGQLPEFADHPSRNFFFQAGTGGGRILIDLETAANVEQINTYSWHPGSRGPQVYVVYAATDVSQLHEDALAVADLTSAGWLRIADVDTRPLQGEAGGQYGVSIFATRDSLGTFRYLIFDMARTESDDPFGNTFFSEIDVIGSPVDPEQQASSQSDAVYSFVIDHGGFQVTIDTSATPDLTAWANTELAPVVSKWYPRIVDLLPSDGFSAPQSFSITFHETNRGVASCSGTRINCSSGWFRQNLQGEAKGAVVHELVHVVQQYRGGRRQTQTNPDALRTPGWLQEGIPDFIRWFLYEPGSRGAEISSRNVANARYDSNYRISANFLNWVAKEHGYELIKQINAELRTQNYTGQIWKTMTGHDVEQLGAMWKSAMEEAIDDGPDALREENRPFALEAVSSD